MYDFNEEYKKLFETPIEEIQEKPFFRADNFCGEPWYLTAQAAIKDGKN